jgi:hypothetical protein
VNAIFKKLMLKQNYIQGIERKKEKNRILKHVTKTYTYWVEKLYTSQGIRECINAFLAWPMLDFVTHKSFMAWYLFPFNQIFSFMPFQVP